MSGMYPNNQSLEIFGEQAQWPGVGPDGKFTNRSFEDPMVKPSFIPAETINLIPGNLSALVVKCGGVPNPVGGGQLAALATHLAAANRLVLRDEHGRAKVAAPVAEDDIARLADVSAVIGEIITSGALSGGGDNLAIMVDGCGRNLFDVFGIIAGTQAQKTAACMAEIRRRCNNNGEIDDTGIPDFTGIMIGDYIDGLDLSAIPEENGGTAGQAWNDTYKNNRIEVAGFNTYKGMGDTENAKNHILFTFRNVPLTKRMNSSDTNSGGYKASELRAFLEGTNGDGTGDKSGVTTAAFMNALKAQLAGGGSENYLCTIRKDHSVKSGSGWASYTVWLPSEIEMFGVPVYGDEGVYMTAITSPSIAARANTITPIHIPLYQKSYDRRVKRYNGARQWHWLQTPYAAAASSFCLVHYYGYTHTNLAGYAGGCAPAFCVA